MIFNQGDKVQVNLGAKGGTKTGNVLSSANDRTITVSLDNGNLAVLNPWDVFHIEEEEL